MGSRKRFIHEAFPAPVLVITTKDADAVCMRNDLAFHDLLRPFAGIPYQAPPPAPNRSGVSSTFCLKFVSLADLQRPTTQAAQALTNTAVSMSTDLNDIMANNGGAFSLTEFPETPWFDRYRRAFFDLIRSSDHEYFNQPLAVIIAVSSQNESPVAALIEAFNAEQPPEAFHTIGLSNQMLRSYVLIHDVSAGSDKAASDTFEKMKVQFGDTACFRLNINSNKNPTPGDVPESIWREVLPGAPRNTPDASEGALDRPPAAAAPTTALPAATTQGSVGPEGADPLTGGASDPLSAGLSQQPVGASDAPHRIQLGQRLVDQDVLRIRSFVEDYGKHSFLPYFDMVVKQLNSHVTHARKGKGLFATSRRWFGGGGGSTKGDKDGGPAHTGFAAVYAKDSMEAQMRRLADYAFIVQDYELAGTMYSNVKKEYSGDKSWKHQAGALEMLGVTMFMQDDANRTEYYRHFESAIMTYLSKCNATLYAIRATLLATEMLLARKQYRDAANAYIRMIGEESDLRSALLLEQAAVCFLNMAPSMQRRAAFHLVLAGHRFSKSTHRKHAIRCYLTAMQVYHKSNWGLAEDHINHTVGRLSLQLGSLRHALQCFSALIARPEQLPAQQTQYLRDFLSTYKEYVAKAPEGEEVELPLPTIARSSIQVLLRATPADDAAGAKSVAVLPESEWANMEELLAQHLKRQLTGAHSSVVFNDSTNNTVHPVCVVHEPIKVRAELRNPLQIPVEITHLSLYCKREDHTPAHATSANAANSSSSATAAAAVAAAVAVAASGASPHSPARSRLSSTGSMSGINITYEAERYPDMTLEGGEARTVEFTLIPREAGKLDIKGISFSLGEDVRGRRQFRVRGRRLNATLAQRTGVEYGQDNRLRLVVTPPMPQLSVSVTGFEQPMLAGQLARGIVRLRNTGSMGLVRLVMVCSQPARMYLGTAADLHNMASGDRSCESLDTAEARAAMAESNVNAVVRVALKNDTLGAGEDISLPLWLWTEMPGASCAHMIFYYESVQPVKHLAYRMVRHSVPYEVVPSLRMSAALQPVPQTLQRMYMHITTENTHPTSEITLLRVYCLNALWEVESVCAGGSSSSSSSGDGNSNSHSSGNSSNSNGGSAVPEAALPSAKDIVVAPRETKVMHFFLRRRATTARTGSETSSEGTLSSLSLSCGYSASFAAGSPSNLFFQRGTQKASRWGEDALRIMLIWCQKSQGIQALAQLHTVARTDPFVPTATPPSGGSEAKAKPQASIVLKHPPTITHDFRRFPILRVPIAADVAVKEGGKEIVLEALRGGSMGGREIKASQIISKPFLWHGKTKMRLEATGGRNMELCACFTEPGVFDVNCVQVVVDGVVAQNLNMEPSLICVLDENA